MRVLLLLRGAPGCGKTTWIEKNGLTQYALSADDIRMMCAGPVMTVDGGQQISVSNDQAAWSILFRLLETRMQSGVFTVVDATNSKTIEMKRYKDMCDTYRYRIYCVDFTGLPIEKCKAQNRMRPEIKQVPDEAIDRMYARFATQKIPSGITVIQPDELDKIWMRKIDLSNYKKIHHIGDIHGCWTVLQQYFTNEGMLKDDEFYIFCGDYIDRGIENVQVVNFLMDIAGRDNVLLLEGNHERWLWTYGCDGVAKSKDFELHTKAELQDAKIDRKAMRQLYRRLGQCAWYTYGDKTVLVTHAGLSCIPENMTLVATQQMIKGVGSYNDFEKVADAFVENTPENTYQIHGHRNTKHLPVQVNERVFNLEGRVEFGGELRVVQLTADGFRTVEISNTVFREPEEIVVYESKKSTSVADVILEMRENKYIQEKRYGDISSFNFTKSAFYDKVWDEQTMKARGLYVDIPKAKIVARAYDKFFNINERPETKFDMLESKLVFPVTAYVKENGFLGLISYDHAKDDFFITTKSSPDGDYAVWLCGIFETIAPGVRECIKQYLKENDVTMVFECVDMVHDPHIIEYPGNCLYLLDIINNELKCTKMPYDQLKEVAAAFGLRCKEKAFVLHEWPEFFDWYYEVTDPEYMYQGRHIEGFVIEDATGYMVKLKLAYYNFWKFMRGVAHEAIRKGHIDGKRTSALTTALANRFYGWVRTLHDRDDVDTLPKDICTLRKMFYASDDGREFITAEGM